MKQRLLGNVNALFAVIMLKVLNRFRMAHRRHVLWRPATESCSSARHVLYIACFFCLLFSACVNKYTWPLGSVMPDGGVIETKIAVSSPVRNCLHVLKPIPVKNYSSLLGIDSYTNIHAILMR